MFFVMSPAQITDEDVGVEEGVKGDDDADDEDNDDDDELFWDNRQSFEEASMCC